MVELFVKPEPGLVIEDLLEPRPAEPDLVLSELVDISAELEKGKAANVGEVRTWNGRKMRKVQAGRWEEVKEGKTAHEDTGVPKRNWTAKAPEGLLSFKQGGTRKKYTESYDEKTDKVTYKAERKALHDKIVGEALSMAQPSKRPVAIVMMGGPASGKTSMLDALKIDRSGMVPINADDVKEALPEYDVGITASYRGTAGSVHEESSDIAQRIKDEAIAQKKPLVFDGTGANAKKYIEMIGVLKAAGYDVHLMMPHLGVTEAKARTRHRAESKGRWVPGDFVNKAYKEIPPNFFAVAAHADSAQLFDNRDGPKLAWEKKRGGEEIHHSPGFLAKFPNAPKPPAGSKRDDGDE